MPANKPRTYVIDYQRGAGLTPWAVYRVMPVARVWLASFATKAEAEAWVATRVNPTKGEA